MCSTTVVLLFMVCLSMVAAIEERWWQLHTEKNLHAAEEAPLDCEDFESCIQKHIAKINAFYNDVTPLIDPTHFTLTDFSKMAAKQVRSWIEEASRYFGVEESPEARQYPTTGYGSYYGNTGYGNYGLYSSPSPSTSVTSLDTALSALAFLAFSVWLLNMLIPHISGANVDLGGLSRQAVDNLPPSVQPELIETLPSNSDVEDAISSPYMQTLSNNMYPSGTIWRQGKKLLQDWLGEDVVGKGKTLLSGLVLKGQEKVQELVKGKAFEDVMRMGADTVSNSIPWDLIRVGLGLPEPEILNAFLRDSLKQGGEMVKTFMSRDLLGDGARFLQEILPRNVMEKGKLFLSKGQRMIEDMMDRNNSERGRRDIGQVWDRLVKSSRSWDPLAYFSKLINDPNRFPDSRRAQEVKVADEASRYEETEIV
ncbi:uncharacterized protein LOC143040917 [Oratosquilla oratoria]|uniref:uncharacterized protein LOC143040917 n=1 Tax=Oratosquilla oratoria TaxID=337810 RepID=UPI003F777B64